MKKLFCLIAIYLVIPFTFIFAQVSPLSNGFYLGSFGGPSVGNYHRSLFFNKYDSLSYNMFVGYIDHLNYDLVCKLFGGFYDSTIVCRNNGNDLLKFV